MTPFEVPDLGWVLAAGPGGGSNTVALIVAVISGLVATIGAGMSYRASSRANASTDRKVDLEEYRDQQARYKDMIDTQEKYSDRLRTQIDRLNVQMDSLQQQLARETDVSNALRDQIRALQGQVSLLQRMTDAYSVKEP